MKAGEAVAGLRGRAWKHRMAALERLDHHATNADTPALVRALADPSSRVRRLAAHAIGCRRCKPGPLRLDVVGLLARVARLDSVLRVRRVALHLLGTQPRNLRARRALAAALRRETDPRTRVVIRWGLTRHGARPPRT